MSEAPDFTGDTAAQDGWREPVDWAEAERTEDPNYHAGIFTEGTPLEVTEFGTEEL